MFEWRSNKTVPQSWEVFKTNLSLYLRPILSALLSIKIEYEFPELCDQLLWMPLFAQSPLALSQWGTEKLLPQVSLYNLGRVSKIITKRIALKTKQNPKTLQSKSQLTYNKSLKYFKWFKNIFPKKKCSFPLDSKSFWCVSFILHNADKRNLMTDRWKDK